MEVSKEFLMDKVARIDELRKQLEQIQDSLLYIMADIHGFCIRDKILEIPEKYPKI